MNNLTFSWKSAFCFSAELKQSHVSTNLLQTLFFENSCILEQNILWPVPVLHFELL